MAHETQRTISPIAYIRSDFPEKFGIPRQSGLARTEAVIEFEPAYDLPETVRGLDAFSHIWLIFGFSENEEGAWHPTVRPPRLGGNARVGVFASRSPFRPNGLGLSLVRLLSVRTSPVRLQIEGADLVDGTPIYDIKPYIPYADAKPDARGGFTDEIARMELSVDFPADLLSQIPDKKRAGLLDLLSQDPRPAYQDDHTREYGLSYAGFNIRFRVEGPTLIVLSVDPLT